MPRARNVILVAEDEPLFLEMIADELRGHSLEVRLARSGREAIAVLRSQTPDLVLLDILMPNVDGFHVLEHIRDAGLRCPVVVLTNLTEESDRQMCLLLGAADFIVKSDLEGSVWPRIKRHLKGRNRKGPADG